MNFNTLLNKYLLAGALIVSFGLYAFLGVSGYTNTGSSNGGTTIATSAGQGSLKDGVFTGNPVDHQYGTVQVKAVVTQGRLSDVVFLQYPNHAQRSQNISVRVMPLLTSEAIQVQNGNVDIVSGATLTSLAFRDSLGSALAQAK